eukprot:1462692-Prymnesium_polylepis.1
MSRETWVLRGRLSCTASRVARRRRPVTRTACVVDALDWTEALDTPDTPDNPNAVPARAAGFPRVRPVAADTWTQSDTER